MEPHIVVFGDVVNGLEFVGPFPTYDAAMDYAEQYHNCADWHVVQLTTLRKD